MSKLSNEELEYYCGLPASILSILGCLFVILIYIFAKPLRIYAFKLIFWLSFFDFIKFSCLIVPNFELGSRRDSACSIIGFIYYYSLYATLIWTLAIALTLYQYLILGIEHIEKFYKYWLALCFTYCTTCAAIPLFSSSYGYNLYVCEITPDTLGIIYKFGFFYCPVIIEIIVITYIYVKIYIKYTLRASTFENAKELSVKRLLAYPLIMAVCLVPGIIANTLSIWGIENDIMVICAYFIWNLHGLINAIAYAMTRPVVIYVKSVICNARFDSSNQVSMFDTC